MIFFLEINLIMKDLLRMLWYKFIINYYYYIIINYLKQ